ncbi:MAG: ABC transporter permease [Firmicutes bacterium]|nr:ABC transporter permease [Bacillota bacterium]
MSMVKEAMAAKRESLLLIILVALILLFGGLSPNFLVPYSFTVMSQYLAEIGLLSLAITIGLISGLLDLSIGSIFGLSAVSIGLLAKTGLNIWVSAFLGVIIGMVAGGLNGILAAFTPIPPLIITLSTQFIFAGISLALTRGNPVTGLPENYSFIGQTQIGPVPLQLLVFLIVTIASSILMQYMGLGRKMRLMGKSNRVAWFSGVNVPMVKIMVYVLSGFLSALASIILTSRVMTARPDAGQTLGWTILTVAFLGGASLEGGTGTILGALFGAMIIVILSTGIEVVGLDIGQRLLTQGLVLLVVAGTGRLLKIKD